MIAAILAFFGSGKMALIVAAAVAGLGILWRALAGAKKAGRNEQIVKQEQADAKARHDADEVQNDVGAMPPDARREELKKWSRK